MPPERPRKLYLGLLLCFLAALLAGASLAQQFRRPPQGAPVVLRAPDPSYDPFGPGPPEIHEAPQDPFQARTPGTVLVPDGGGGWNEVPATYQGNLPFPTHGGVMVPDAKVGWREVHPPAQRPAPPVRIDPSPNSYGGMFHSR